MKVIISLLLLSAFPALANDTFGSIDTGNIRFKKSADIRMESEDLFISLDQTIVKYSFVNDGKKPVKDLVIFPLPEIELETPHVVDFETREGPLANPLKFVLKVDGKQMPIESKIKIDDDKRIMDLNYHWDMTFPPGKSVSVEHEYLTSPGSSFPKDADKRFCFDAEFKKSFEALKSDAESNKIYPKGPEYSDFTNWDTFLHYHSRQIRYILKTGANWKGPIGKFKLTIDKGKVGNLIATCFKGLKKESDTTLVFEQSNYKPATDLDILIIRRSKL